MSADDAILDVALDLFRRAGVDGEIFLERSVKTAITVCDGRVESHVERRSLGAGIRVFEDARVAFAFTADLDREGLSRAIELARAIAPHTKQDEANVLPEIAGSRRAAREPRSRPRRRSRRLEDGARPRGRARRQGREPEGPQDARRRLRGFPRRLLHREHPARALFP